MPVVDDDKPSVLDAPVYINGAENLLKLQWRLLERKIDFRVRHMDQTAARYLVYVEQQYRIAVTEWAAEIWPDGYVSVIISHHAD